MKQTLTINEIADQLRADENAAWSYEGARALAEYLDETMSENAELDRVEVRCDWSEHESLTEWATDYFGHGVDWSNDLGIREDADSTDVDETIKDYITARGVLLELPSGKVIVSSF